MHSYVPVIQCDVIVGAGHVLLVNVDPTLHFVQVLALLPLKQFSILMT